MDVQPLFRDRHDAGQQLAAVVKRTVTDTSALILALPRGGVPVGFEVALAIRADLDIFLVRKLGLPGQEELAIGAIASGGVRVLNEDLIRELRVSLRTVEQLAAREQAELQRREASYRQGRPAVPVEGRTVVLVDDGLATGASMRAAVEALRVQKPRRLLVAVPVAAEESCRELEKRAEEVLCVYTPEPFMAVGIWYENFAQTTDEEVQELLRWAEQRSAALWAH